MKKVLASLIFVILFSSFGFSQGIPQLSRQFTFTSATTQPAAPGLNITALGIGYFKLNWDVAGSTLSACTVSLQGSSNGVSWPTNIISSQTCTTDGQTIVTATGTSSTYVRVNVLTYTASGAGASLNVVVQGWNEVTSATATNPSFAGAVIQYNTTRPTLTTGQTTVVNSTSDSLMEVASTPTIDGAVAMTTAFTSTLGSTIFAIKASQGNLYGYDIFNPAAAACFLQIFDVASGSVTLGTTVPKISSGIPIAGAKIIATDKALLNSTTGLSAAFTTTATGNTICGTVGIVTFWYK